MQFRGLRSILPVPMAAKDAPPTLPWPDQESSLRPGETVRATLDYICWVVEQMLEEQDGFHSGSRRDEWRRRVHTAYVALFRPVVAGHGDPYPPDVPPARTPGRWPDVPASSIPGMTLRHQLTVIGMLCHEIRSREWLHARSGQTEEWERRIVRCFAALDHGDTLILPDDARSEPSAEVLAAAQAEARARAALAKRRTAQLRKQMDRMRRLRAEASTKRPAKKAKAAAPKAPKKKAVKKKVAKKSARKKAAKSAKKKAAKKKAVKKKTAKKKTAKKRPASPKKAPKRTARKSKKAPKKKAVKKKTAKKR